MNRNHVLGPSLVRSVPVSFPVLRLELRRRSDTGDFKFIVILKMIHAY